MVAYLRGEKPEEHVAVGGLVDSEEPRITLHICTLKGPHPTQLLG